ncbi:hypothetical protein KUTeg_019164 [Tegillarca granosa]|uniref:Uncharacterized protein n=1 Tax=Tegillarca granosa TaxID=220873 RepID=A0ABQ9EBR2_TEGGR|nr:hypothetical protein KUTeg_019164 [Tegillarca granosa]
MLYFLETPTCTQKMSRMKSSLVIGASRGIGRQIALTLSSNGYKVGVASKTVQSTEKLPGSIHSVVDEIVKSGGEAVPIQFGGLDLAVYNAGAIMWKKVIDTPLKNFDLMQEVNVRGAYTMLQCVLPHFLQKNSGRIILVSPPIYNRLNGQALIDEDYLRTKGVTDFSKYNCVPDSEPPRIMPKKFPSLLVEEEDVDLSSKL